MKKERKKKNIKKGIISIMTITSFQSLPTATATDTATATATATTLSARACKLSCLMAMKEKTKKKIKKRNEMKNQRKNKKEVTAPKGKAAERKSVCVLCVLCVLGRRELHSTCTRHKKRKKNH